MRKLILTTLISLLPLSSWAGSSNVGTSGAAFLKIGAGARPTAMGEAFVGIADDVNAVYYNPAGLGFIKEIELTAMHTQWFQDVDYHFAAAALPTKYGAFGFAASTLKVNDQQKRGNDEGLLGTFDPQDAAYGLSYSHLLTSNFSLGGTLRFIDQEIDSAEATTWGSDVGALLKLNRWPASLGLAIRHIGQKVKFNEESDPLPLTVDAGIGTHFFQEKLQLGLNVQLPRDHSAQVGVGGEWNQPLAKDFRFAARLGYNTATTDPDGASGISLGGGLGFRSFDLDFAWVPFGDLGDTFRYAALVRFGGGKE